MNEITLLIQGVSIILLSIAAIKNAVEIGKNVRDLRRLEKQIQTMEQITESYRIKVERNG